ncbi:ankyrin repeat domain-containing protein [Streptomyces sp. SID9727]|uniref:ankyrin repeat domain-containing protein n=1 Tax=Streptomyces sp. SID9727 TaxID=2706114 RepID=UPI0013C7F278|nr:ankyrin repeat domain-containing protein [Streptomyces sp. SID9727]NEC68623.1 ankyrin repeat domain-containing protein [Streptomyces sp. SID9727]
MSPRDVRLFLSPQEASSWRQVRRYAVPRSMIEESAALRKAGDWRGACAAAGFDVRIDVDRVSATYGAGVAEALLADLRDLVPDLLRWHLPRILAGRSTLATDRTVLLAGYGSAPGAYLQLSTPAMADGPQRLTLRFGPPRRRTEYATVENWQPLGHLWRASRAGELRARAGGGTDRLPFLAADGTPLPADRLPREDPGGGDPVARAEWVNLLYADGRIADALAAAGIEWDPTPPEVHAYHRTAPENVMAGLALDVARLDAQVRRYAELDGAERFRIGQGWRVRVLLDFTAPGLGGRLRIRVVSREASEGAFPLPETAWRRMPDLDLLSDGVLTPADLHPLVARSLFPEHEGPCGPPAVAPPAPVRVRCRGDWHEVRFRDGALDSPHTAQEHQRESALRAFGGAVTGCFAVEHACRTGVGRLPQALAAQRRDLFLRAQHGDTEGVLALLDAGVDPRVRDGGKHTLLHVLPLLDHTVLLPRLLAAGLDLEARDHRERTPLSVAVSGRGTAELVRDLLDAGARIDVSDQTELSLEQMIRKYRRTDLRFLAERVLTEHPDAGSEWWDEWNEDEDDDEEGEDA